jgi:transposase
MIKYVSFGSVNMVENPQRYPYNDNYNNNHIMEGANMYTHPTVLRCRKQAMVLDARKTLNRREVASRCQMSHTTFYKFLKRYEEQGEDGLHDRDRIPTIWPNQTPPDVEEAILDYIQNHPAFGPKRISAELKRQENGCVKVGETAVYGVLKRKGLNTMRDRLKWIDSILDQRIR